MCYPRRVPRSIPAAGINLFQLIYTLVDEYQAKSGQPALNLSLGNPDGVPEAAIRELKAAYASDPGYDYHSYAESRDLLGFAEAMVELHGRIRLAEHRHLAALPIPGIKTASALVPLACGLHLPDARRRARFRLVSNLPAYDVIGTWGQDYLGARRVVWPLSAESGMRLDMRALRAALKKARVARPGLVFVIRPGNPASVGASADEWRELIRFCLKTGARLVNDAAYAGLADPERHVPLAAVAKDFPGLDWLELYSVSKSFSDPGARLGALVGSRDFVSDFLVIKGNTDSGPVPSVMAAYGRFLADRRACEGALASLRALYRRRLEYLVPRLRAAGLEPACAAEAGFFTLWKVPRKVLGNDLAALAAKTTPKGRRDRSLPLAETFNRLVIRETGIVGVHFDAGAPLIRYAVCADVLSPVFQRRFEEQLARLQPAY